MQSFQLVLEVSVLVLEVTIVVWEFERNGRLTSKVIMQTSYTIVSTSKNQYGTVKNVHSLSFR